MVKLGNVFILGDSYSTFKGCIPDGYDPYYSEDETDITDVRKKEQTWWHLLLENTKSALIQNNSFSGTTVCNTGYGANFCPDTSFVGRLEKLISDGFFKINNVDTFLFFGGTNDSWADSPIGELCFEEQSDEEIKSVLPAFCRALSDINKYLPDVQPLVIINSELKKEITDGFKIACEHYGIDFIQLENIEKQNGHPNIAGMKQIFTQVYSFLEKAK